MMIKNNYRLTKQKSIKTTFFLQSLLKNCILILIPLLIIGPYSMLKSISDNTEALEKSTLQTLMQLDNTVDGLFAQVDNANMFFASNPRITVQMRKAFSESSVSLTSLKNIENFSLYFQNLLFTDLYIQNLYIYYDNEFDRIYLPPKGAIQNISSPAEEELVESYRNSAELDFWMEVKEQNENNRLLPKHSLFIYQKLYTRSTANTAGFLAFEYNLSKLGDYFDSILQYNNQILYVTNANGEIIYTNSETALPDSELSHLLKDLEDSEEQQLFSAELDQQKIKAAYLKSDRLNGFTYISVTPSSELYKTTRALSATYILLAVAALISSIVLAFYKTNKEYSYLNDIIDLFSKPEQARTYTPKQHSVAGNPFEYITFNIIRLFLEQDYMKMQDLEKEYKMKMLKVQALQYQINPHFLHNTLNSIYWESVRLTASENSCSTMVANLSSVMRYVLDDPHKDVTISQEIAYLKTYLDIMKIRHSDNFDTVFRIDPRCGDYPISKMLLQPLVENSIYHGVKPKEEKCTIGIGVKKLPNSIGIYICDTGIGIPADRLEQLKEQLAVNEQINADHVGLSNTDMRLKMAYGSDRGLRIKSMENRFTCVYFFL